MNSRWRFFSNQSPIQDEEASAAPALNSMEPADLLRTGAIAMENGVKYQILLYNKSTARFETSLQATAGEPTEIVVVKNQEYEWYAYSFDSKEEIPAIDLGNLVVPSQTDRPLLFAKGLITATQLGSTPLAITFQHQLAQLQVQVDARGMFGNIQELEASFVEEYVKTGNFDLRTGAFTGQLTVVPVDKINFMDLEPGLSRLKLARYYTADLSLQKYAVQFSTLNLKLINDEVKALAGSFPEGGLVTFDNFVGSNQGKIQQGLLKMWKIFPRKKILHVEGSTLYSYAASNPKKASGAFICNPANFGLQSQYCRIDGFEHEIISGLSANAVSAALADPTLYPAIIIAGMFTNFTANDYDALYTYIERGGVVFLMIENLNTPHVTNFMQRMFGPQVSIANDNAAGAKYTMTQSDGEVLSWPFGDVRGKDWGEDASLTLFIKGIPEGVVEVYTTSARNFPASEGVSMFRHKTKNFFYVGDTGFLSNEKQNGQYTSTIIEPFATTSSDLPAAHSRYGALARLVSPDYPQAAGSWQAHNSIIFGKVFAFLEATSDYMGVNKTP